MRDQRAIPDDTTRATADQDLGSGGGSMGMLVQRLGEQGARRYVQRRMAQRRMAATAASGEASRAPVEGAPVDEATAMRAAERGTTGGGGALPHAAAIQRAFGRHDISGVQAHEGDHAAGAAQAMGAEAYAMGNHVVFGESPSLHTAAHEAAHVVQQRAGVGGSGLGAPDSEHERAADQVADRVVGGGSAEALLDRSVGASGGNGAQPTVQRKVKIKRMLTLPRQSPYRDKTGNTSRGDAVRDLMTDAPVRYFDSKDELSNFAAGRAEGMGMVNNDWVHLPDSLVVLGESHSAAVTAGRIAHDVRSTRFKHEAVTGMPEDQSQNADVRGVLTERRTALVGQSKLPAGVDDSNVGEDFFPKLLRGIANVTFGGGGPHISAVEVTLLRMGLQYAAATTGQLRTLYNANRDIFVELEARAADRPLQTFIGLLQAQREAVEPLVAEMLVVARQKIAAMRDSAPAVRDRFDAHHDPDAAPRYGGNGIADEADHARDLSMYKHIKAAKAANMQLYGMGENHRLRLKPLLDRDGIKNQTVTEFMNEQRAKHPQD